VSCGDEWIGLNGVLDWLARVRIAGVEPMSHGVGITERRVRFHAKRLEQERLLIRSRIDGNGPLMTITPRGLRRAGYPANSRNPTKSVTGLQHGRGVSWIAAYCELRGRAWLGPAELRAEGWPLQVREKPGKGPRTHMPDLGFILDGTEKWAVEFERVSKSEDRLRGILRAYRTAELAGELESVLYVCADQTIVRLVQKVAAEVNLDRAVRTLDWLIQETRAWRNGHS
jgi:hypothetical protein